MSLFPPTKNRSDCATSTAILVAYRNAHVLHQDISVGNVMLGEERSDGLKTTAILNDWDRAQRLNALSDDHRLVIIIIYSSFECSLILERREHGHSLRSICFRITGETMMFLTISSPSCGFFFLLPFATSSMRVASTKECLMNVIPLLPVARTKDLQEACPNPFGL